MVGIQRSILTAFVAAILVSSVASAVVSATPSAAPPPSAVRVAVIMFTLPSATTFAVTPDDVRTTYFGTDRSVATLYALASRGTLQITGDVFGPYAIGGDASTCDLGTWTDAARSAATGAGVDLSSYTNFAFLFPRVDACPWAGLAAIGDSSSYINAPAPGDVGLYHAAHELGHDLGADHAHSLTCAVNGSAVSFAQPDTCTSSEYGDPFSLMGSGIVRLPSAWERMRMGLLNANELTVADAGASASYALADLDSSQPGTRLVLLRRAAGGYLTLEYRLAGGPFDTFAGTSATAGVFVHFVADDQSSDSSLLDATPSTSTMHDAYITPGSRLDDDIDGLSISVTGADSSAAQVTVGPLVVDQEPVTAPPSPPAAPTQVSGSTTGGGSAHLTWQPASDATAATQYRIRRAGAVVAVVSGTTFDDGQTLVSATTYGVARQRDDVRSSGGRRVRTGELDRERHHSPGVRHHGAKRGRSGVGDRARSEDCRHLLDGRLGQRPREALRNSAVEWTNGLHEAPVQHLPQIGCRIVCRHRRSARCGRKYRTRHDRYVQPLTSTHYSSVRPR